MDELYTNIIHESISVKTRLDKLTAWVRELDLRMMEDGYTGGMMAEVQEAIEDFEWADKYVSSAVGHIMVARELGKERT